VTGGAVQAGEKLFAVGRGGLHGSGEQE